MMFAKNAPHRYVMRTLPVSLCFPLHVYYKAVVRQLPGGILEDILSTVDIICFLSEKVITYVHVTGDAYVGDSEDKCLLGRDAV
jgi:hypothetical protein